MFAYSAFLFYRESRPEANPPSEHGQVWKWASVNVGVNDECLVFPASLPSGCQACWILDLRHSRGSGRKWLGYILRLPRPLLVTLLGVWTLP